jgi:hypothetical protein
MIFARAGLVIFKANAVVMRMARFLQNAMVILVPKEFFLG